MGKSLPPEAYLRDADFDDWVSLPGWTADEAVMLFAGLNPKVVRPDSVVFRSNALPSEIHRSLDMAVRAVLTGHIPEHCPPLTFVEWALTEGLTVDPRLHAAAKARGPVLNWKSECERLETECERLKQKCKDLEARNAELKDAKRSPRGEAVESLHIMALGMALKKYGYDPTAKRQDAVVKITGDILECGLKINEGTVRGHLARAARDFSAQLTQG